MYLGQLSCVRATGICIGYGLVGRHFVCSNAIDVVKRRKLPCDVVVRSVVTMSSVLGGLFTPLFQVPSSRTGDLDNALVITSCLFPRPYDIVHLPYFLLSIYNLPNFDCRRVIARVCALKVYF
jgi:hypothetical protein